MRYNSVIFTVILECCLTTTVFRASYDSRRTASRYTDSISGGICRVEKAFRLPTVASLVIEASSSCLRNLTERGEKT